MSKPPLLREEATGTSVRSLDEARENRRIEQLTRAHRPYLQALARKLCRGNFDSDDLVQEVLVKTMQATLTDVADERAWMARTMHNLFIDWVRRRATRREDELFDAPAPIPEEEAWWQQLTTAKIREQLALIPTEQRVTFELFAFEGKTYDEIAAELGIAKATVGTRILRARAKLRELLIARNHG